MDVEKQFDSINKIEGKTKQLERYYYKRPTPVEVLFEENDTYLQKDYSGRHIYEWNIHGFSDNQIVSTIHRILMYSTICRQHGNTDRQIASYITCGFTGIFKGWWDNYLTTEQRNEILSAVKIENTQQMEDAVYTLALAIVEYFTGVYVDQRERVRTLLQNLRCPSLTHFRWYKDTFLS